MTYIDIPIEISYRLINHGPVVILASRDEKGINNIAPIAWNSPVCKEPPLMMSVVAKKHKTRSNITAQKEFIVCVPHVSQVELVRQTGSVSGHEIDKFQKLSIKGIAGKKVAALVPEGCIGYLECKVVREVEIDDKEVIFIGEIVAAAAQEGAFEERLLIEKDEGRSLHHLGGAFFTAPDANVINSGR